MNVVAFQKQLKGRKDVSNHLVILMDAMIKQDVYKNLPNHPRISIHPRISSHPRMPNPPWCHRFPNLLNPPRLVN